MRIKRRQVLLGGMVAGISATTATEYQHRQAQRQLQALAKEQIPQNPESLLEATFNADAEKIFQGQSILASLNLTPPTLPYNRELSKLLIACSKIATQQYLTGKTIPTYDGSIQSLPAYFPSLKNYTQVASFRGKEAQVSESVTVEVPTAARGDAYDPVERKLDTAENEIGEAIKEIVQIKREIPVYLGFVLSSEQHNIIVFRGTQTRIEWINNFTAVQIDYTDPLSGQYFGKIHEGFIRNYLRIVDPVPRELAKQLNLSVPCYVTGHSLGASLAILAALDIALNLPQLKDRLHLYTYASPRVGDPTFARLHSKMIPNSYRITNLADVITLMPPTKSVGTYVHVGQKWSFLTQEEDFMPNHVVDTYQAAVKAEVESDRDRTYPNSGLADKT